MQMTRRIRRIGVVKSAEKWRCAAQAEQFGAVFGQPSNGMPILHSPLPDSIRHNPVKMKLDLPVNHPAQPLHQAIRFVVGLPDSNDLVERGAGRNTER